MTAPAPDPAGTPDSRSTPGTAPGQAATPGEAAHAGYMENDTANLVADEDIAARIWAGMGHERTRWENAALRAHEAIAAAAPAPAAEGGAADVSGNTIRAAQAYDYEHRPPKRNWTRVPDDQVERLILGAATGLQPHAAPELAAAMAEARDVRDGYAKLCEEFSDSPQSGQSARISLTVLNRHRKAAGLNPRRAAPFAERKDTFMQMREKLDAIAELAAKWRGIGEQHAEIAVLATDKLTDVAERAKADVWHRCSSWLANVLRDAETGDRP